MGNTPTVNVRVALASPCSVHEIKSHGALSIGDHHSVLTRSPPVKPLDFYEVGGQIDHREKRGKRERRMTFSSRASYIKPHLTIICRSRLCFPYHTVSRTFRFPHAHLIFTFRFLDYIHIHSRMRNGHCQNVLRGTCGASVGSVNLWKRKCWMTQFKLDR